MITGTKLCWNLHESSFVLLSDDPKINWVGKRLLVRSKALGLFFNSLTADDKDSRWERENLPQPIQIVLYEKPKTFYQYVTAVLVST